MERLKQILNRIDGRGYKAYKELKGLYDFSQWMLHIDRVQGDPFASPTRVRLIIPVKYLKIPKKFCGFPERIATADFFAREVWRLTSRISKNRGTGKSGLIYIEKNGQEILERTNAVIKDGNLEIRLGIGLPAAGRRILGSEAMEMFFKDLPAIVNQLKKFPITLLEEWITTYINYFCLALQLKTKKLVAFVPEGSILPRRSGVDDRPLYSGVIPFNASDSLMVELSLSDGTTIRGMGIPEGVTLITGGGYHGKSTLLKAIEKGIYPHIPGDGREYCVTIPEAVKIRAEDGRRVESVDISPFINYLPFGKSTENFSTDNASGSTSQAANIMEALELGAKLLLLDEDTCATNFMIRDERMQELIAKENEPITPFIDRVRELYQRFGVSTILVMGGAGDYLDVADRVIMMKEFQAIDVTEEARRVIERHPTRRRIEPGKDFSEIKERIPLPESIDPSMGRKRVKIKAMDIDEIGFGKEKIDLSCVEQIVEKGQVRAIGLALHYLKENIVDGKRSLGDCLWELEKKLNKEGLDLLNYGYSFDLAMPRTFEIGAALNRLRTLRIKQIHSH